jgi:succinate dehydrogenase / fumarate reductase membrane anchor subunit
MASGTPIGEVRGLGSAHCGEDHWMLQRYTAIGNLVLGAWFVASILLIGKLDAANVHDWLGGLVPVTLMILLIASTFWHARLGLQVIVEDYVHEQGNKFAVTALLNLVAIGGAVFGVLCVLKLALGGAA